MASLSLSFRKSLNSRVLVSIFIFNVLTNLFVVDLLGIDLRVSPGYLFLRTFQIINIYSVFV